MHEAAQLIDPQAKVPVGSFHQAGKGSQRDSLLLFDTKMAAATSALQIPKSRMPDVIYKRCLGVVRNYLKTHDRVTNRAIREAAGINYDQAIAFFNLAIANRALVRKGLSGSTHYVLPGQET